MSTFTFLVTVETEREGGLIVSRDEQAEKIVEAIENAAPEADLSGLGARSDSEYSVTSVEVWPMDKKDLKEANAEYETAVLAAKPSDSEMAAELKRLRKELADAKARVAGAENAAEAATKALREVHPVSRTWMGSNWDEEGMRYLPDGRHDSVKFRYGEREESFMTVEHSDQGGIEIRVNDAWGDLAVFPMSGNVVRLATVNRH